MRNSTVLRMLTTEDFAVDVLDILLPLIPSCQSDVWHRAVVCSRERTWPPDSSSHSLNFSSLAANESASFSVSPGATAASTSTPLPIEDTSCWSTVTEAERTRCSMAEVLIS